MISWSIYTNSIYEYKRNVKIILKHLRSAGVFLDMIKREFYIIKVLYLESIINTHGIKINPIKIKTILE